MRPLWQVEFASSAARELSKLASKDRRRILLFLNDRIATHEDPRRVGHALTGPFAGLWSYRVGAFRLIAAIEDKRVTIVIVRIGSRREIYR